MQQVIEEKQELVDSALKNRMNVSEAVQIGGDLFSMGYLGFQGAQMIRPSISSIPAIAFSSLVCGVIAGAINIGVAFVCLKEGIQASKNGDTKLATRLYLDFASLLAIGLIMMLTSIAVRVAALGVLTAFFAANPWLLPVIFFILSIPIIIEVAGRIKNICQKRDLGSAVKASDLPKQLQDPNEKNPFSLKPLIDMAERGVNDQFIKIALSQKMELFQANMGVEAALETFRLLKQILKNEEMMEQLEKTKKKIAEWNKAQWVRMFQQVLYTAAFAVSLIALSPRMNTPSVNGGQTFAMAAANATALYMDTYWPFKRNTPIVVPMAAIPH
jgi:ABC-type multidrug transport system fused ATPase/permease subunit